MYGKGYGKTMKKKKPMAKKPKKAKKK